MLKKRPQKKLEIEDPNKRLKQAIWLYYLLLLFEGALRKWILPPLSTPLLIVRDPVAMYIIYEASRRKMIPASGYIYGMVITSIISTFTAVLFGHGNLIVALYGARIFFLHFPLILIIANVFNYEDVVRMGRVTLYIAIPMAVLVTMQFYSPQSAFINRGVGGDEAGGGFSGALGYFRPPGTFSFTNGNTLFFSFIAPFVFYFWLNIHLIKRWVLIGATIGLLIAIPLSISRSLLFGVVITVAFALLAVAKKPQYLTKIIAAIIGVTFLLVILSQISIFQTAIEAFTARFEGANESEGGLQSVLLDRYLGGLYSALFMGDKVPLWGGGIGAGTNIGVNLLNRTDLLVVEGEWQRIVLEQGFIIGLAVIIMRTGLSLQAAMRSYKSLGQGNILPWLLLSYFLINVPQGQWKQPTSLGFSVMIGGLLFASLKFKKKFLNPTVSNKN